MLPTRTLDSVILHLSPDQRDIVFEVRSIVARIAPDAFEDLRRTWISYYHKGKGGPVSAGICEVDWKETRIRLHFLHGAFLPDPHHLLQGDRIAKRFMEIPSFDDAPWEAIEQLIAASSRFAPRSLSQNQKKASK